MMTLLLPGRWRVCAATIRFEIRDVAGTAELRAAAYLRAQSFYTCPEDRSDYAKRAYLRMKADATWSAMERRAAGEDIEYAQVDVTTLIAASPNAESGMEDLHRHMVEGSTALPARGGAPPELVVGTLDLNIGAKLPAEELVGREPTAGDAARLRAYLSNVCVLGSVQTRRQGIAQALIREAVRRATAAGVSDLYVHVVADNIPARCLYEKRCGFLMEQEESESMARALNRPRRLLLRQSLNVEHMLP